jgi:hypothetical protein
MQQFVIPFLHSQRGLPLMLWTTYGQTFYNLLTLTDSKAGCFKRLFWSELNYNCANTLLRADDFPAELQKKLAAFPGKHHPTLGGKHSPLLTGMMPSAADCVQRSACRIRKERADWLSLLCDRCI